MYQEPEILRIPLEDLLLQMRTMGIERLEDFPFPTTPPSTGVGQVTIFTN